MNVLEHAEVQSDYLYLVSEMMPIFPEKSDAPAKKSEFSGHENEKTNSNQMIHVLHGLRCKAAASYGGTARRTPRRFVRKPRLRFWMCWA